MDLSPLLLEHKDLLIEQNHVILYLESIETILFGEYVFDRIMMVLQICDPMDPFFFLNEHHLKAEELVFLLYGLLG